MIWVGMILMEVPLKAFEARTDAGPSEEWAGGVCGGDIRRWMRRREDVVVMRCRPAPGVGLPVMTWIEAGRSSTSLFRSELFHTQGWWRSIPSPWNFLMAFAGRMNMEC